MRICWASEAWHDYERWLLEDKKTIRRINKLIDDIERTPFTGLGKPEPLKHQLSGLWSRRIDEVNRLVYAVSGDDIQIMQCRYHYAD